MVKTLSTIKSFEPLRNKTYLNCSKFHLKQLGAKFLGPYELSITPYIVLQRIHMDQKILHSIIWGEILQGDNEYKKSHSWNLVAVR